MNTPAHYMTKKAIKGQREPIAVLVYEIENDKCHTIYGDILKSDLVNPTKEQLNFIQEASNGMATTKIDRIRLGIKNDGCWNCKFDNSNYEKCKANVKRPMLDYTEDGEDWLKVDRYFICTKFKKV